MDTILAIEIPSKERDEGAFQLVAPLHPMEFNQYFLGRGNCALLENLAGKYYKFAKANKHELTHLIIFTDHEHFHEESVRGGIQTTIFRGNMAKVIVLEAFASLNFTIESGHWWLKYGLPMMILAYMPIRGYAYLSWVNILLAIYLMKGREYLMEKSLRKEFDGYITDVKEGIDKLLKDPTRVTMVTHPGLSAIRDGIESHETVAEGYAWAIHNCGKYGFPELRKWYIKNAGYDEWRKQEVGIPFRVYDKPPVEEDGIYKERDYSKDLMVPDSKELYKEVFDVL